MYARFVVVTPPTTVVFTGNWVPENELARRAGLTTVPGSLAPVVDGYLPRREAARLVELLARLVISYFLAPSEQVDLGDPESAGAFIEAFILPAFQPTLTRS